MKVITANTLRVGQVITYGVYDDSELLTVLVTEIEHTNNSLTDEWYDSNKADTLDTVTTTQLRVWFTTLDGQWADCFVVSGTELITLPDESA